MAVSKKQNVRFDFYQAVQTNDRGETSVCDISDFIQEINTVPVENRLKNYFGEPSRMDRIHNEPEDETLTYFHMLRFRDEGLASANEVSEELKDIALDEGDYIAEDINCIFDSDSCVLMIQRNFHSLSISGVREYLISMYSVLRDDDLSLDFCPVPDLNVLENALSTDKYRKISFRFASNYRDSLPSVFTNLVGGFADIFRSLGGDNLTLTLGAQRSRPDLHADQSRQLIQAIADNRTMFSSALVTGKQGDAPVELYDLLNGKLSVYYKFTTTRKIEGQAKKIHLNPISVEEEMMRLYVEVNDYRSKVRRSVGRR